VEKERKERELLKLSLEVLQTRPSSVEKEREEREILKHEDGYGQIIQLTIVEKEREERELLKHWPPGAGTKDLQQ